MRQLNKTLRKPGRPPDQALQQRRCEEILRQAEALFARNGYASSDIQLLADALGLSKGTIYRYFPTKQRLFLAVVRDGVRRLAQHVEQVGAAVEDPIERLGAAVRAYLQFFKANPQLVELFIQERAAFKARRKPVYFEKREAARGRWSKVIAGEMARGRLRQIPVQRVLDVMGDVVYGAMFTNHFTGRGQAFASQAADILDVVFHGILSPAERTRRRNAAIG